jgi:hypothetical protein
MRTTAIILFTTGLLSLSSCEQKIEPSVMLENSKTRTELFDVIASNQSYMSEFMNNMQQNDHAIQMMQGNQKMIGNMMQGQGMQMMTKDSIMMKNIMQSMVKDGKMMGNMMQMMHEKGMMSEDCMKSSIIMMGNEGMEMDGMNKMKK